MNIVLAVVVAILPVAIPSGQSVVARARATAVFDFSDGGRVFRPGDQSPQQPNLVGRVLHADLPVPGATVTATRGQRTVTTTSDENGVFRFAGLEPGGWTTKIEMRGFATVTQDITIPFDQPELSVTLTMRKYEEMVASGLGNVSWPALSVTADGLPKPGDATVTAGAEDPTILTGSTVNGAASRFAQPRAIGNNRPRPAGLYSGAFNATLGNSAWNAQPYSFTGSAAPKPNYADTQLSMTFGGPFRIPFLLKYGPNTQVTYQHGVQNNASSQSALVPTFAERSGDLSSRLGVIRDPLTGLPFDGNVIPADRIVPQAAALLPFYPQPNVTTSTGANYQRALVGQSTSNSVQVSSNYALNPRSSLNGTFSYQRTRGNPVNLFDFIDSNRSSSIAAGLTWNQQLSRRITMRVNYQFTSASTVATPFFANRLNVSGEAGIFGNAQDPFNWGPPTILFPDFADLRDTTYQSTSRASHFMGGQIMMRRGSHNITMGADARFNRSDLLTQPDPRGTLTFTGAATGDAFADFLLGIPTTSAIATGNSNARIRGGLYDAYVNDDFRFRAGLTFDVGVRWEYETPYTERHGRLANLDVSPGFGAVASVLGSDPIGGLTGTRYRASLVQRDRLGFEPRIGVSWRPMLASSLVIKGGYGLYRNLGVYQSIGTLLAQQPPFTSTSNIQNTAATPLTLANPFPAAIASATTFAVDPEFTTALLHSWQVTLQRDLPASLTTLVAYFGDRGTHLAQAFLPNTYAPGSVNPCVSCPSGFMYLTSGGTSTRNAAQFIVRRRLYAGFTSSVTYTLAKAMDNASTFSNTSVSPGSLAVAQDWRDLDAERGPSSFDQRHLVSIDMQYTSGMGLTGGTLVDGFWGGLFKDWTVTARFNAGSGLPLTPVFFATVPGSGVVGMRPSLTGEPIAPTENGRYVNPAAFTAPAPGTWGNAVRNSIRGPSTSSFDLTLARAFRFPKRKTLEWRLAATNVLNRVTFATVDRIITSPQFGRPTAASQMRRIQTFLSFKF